MKRVFILLLCFSFFATPLFAAGSGEVQFVRKAYEELTKLNSEKKVVGLETSKKVLSFFNFDILFKRIVQDFESKLSREEYEDVRDTFLLLFTKNIEKKGLNFSGKKLSGIKYKLESKKKNESVVILLGRAKEHSVKIEFTLIPHEQSWKIADLSLNDALLSRNYRGQFNRIYRVEGVEGLMKRIQIKLASL